MLTRLSIKGRLFTAFAFLLTILLVVSASGLWAVREIRENLRVVYEERAVPTQLVAQVNYLSQRNRVLVMDMLVNPSDANSRKRLSEFDLNVRAIDEVLARYAAITRPPQQTALYEQFLKAWNTYMQDGLLKASQAMAKGDFDEAQFVYLNKISPLAPALQSSMEALMNSQLTLAGEGYESAKDMAQSASVSVASMLAVGVALGLLLAWAVARSITRPIELAGDMAQRVASGDLLPEPLAGGDDEMAHLIHKLDFMRGGLAEIVKEVREGSALIAASSGEISHGVSDLSQRTEAQASNLQEASASLDTLLRGTHEHATVSQQASSIAKAAYDSAAKGESSVEKLIVQIGTVSERSQRITEITSVIDSIAFQTNILALNAAVEAARAGEQGRGFAVVAQEVRVLAQRSAAAASEIKMLIVDAVNSVVQVTSMASSTGDSVRGFVAQVREVDVLIGQLSHASHEQARQLAQISEAIRHIDGMTQQNAALVEENAAAAMSLNHEASELDNLVASFKIQETGIVALSAA